MKIKYMLLLFFIILLMPTVSKAESCYYKNDNAVCLTLEEYNHLVNRFWVGFPETMTIEDYKKLVKQELINSTIDTVEFIDKGNENGIVPFASYYETGSKSIKISKVCTSSYCGISVVVEWFVSPVVRSYDVIGAYLDGVSMLTTPTTYVTSSSGTTSSNEIVNQTNGFGVSIKLPTNGNNIVLYQYYDTGTTGTIYQSYQHAKSSISLSNSKKYTVSRTGYGGVFLFNSDVRSKYDGMGGVSLSL